MELPEVKDAVGRTTAIADGCFWAFGLVVPHRPTSARGRALTTVAVSDAVP